MGVGHSPSPSCSLLIIAVLLGCGKAPQDAASEAESTGVCIPGGTPTTMPATAREYVAMCEPELGVPPDLDCSLGVELPITVDGVPVDTMQAPHTCDAYSLQDGECVPGSTLNRLTGRDRDGSERPEVVWVQFCRNEGALVADSEDVAWTYTGAQMIGYNTDTGATCFFELNYPAQAAYLSIDEDYRITSTLPSHDDPAFDDAYLPAPSQCVQCHQNDPFVHSPWTDTARLPSNPNEAVLPVLAADAPYYVVGGSDWDMRTIHIEGNACLDCHRIGMETDMLFRYNGLSADQWMPKHAVGSLAEDYAELLDCWENGPEQTEGCIWWYPPGGGCDGREAGDGYPFAASDFNFARDDFYGF